MLQKLLWFLLVLPEILAFQQNDYTLEFERADVVNFDKKYVENLKAVTFKYNRTQPALNVSVTLTTNLGVDLEVTLQAYTFLSNEYRLFPLQYTFNFCDAVKNNDYGFANINKYGNFSGCPIKKGNYYANKWIPDSSRFPPRIPNGRYMIELNALYLSNIIVTARGYGTVSRPLGRRH